MDLTTSSWPPQVRLTKGTLLRGVDQFLILSRVGYPVDHDAVDRSFSGFELQTQLFLNRSEDGGADLLRCCAIVARRGRVGNPIKRPVEFSGEGRPIQNRP